MYIINILFFLTIIILAIFYITKNNQKNINYDVILNNKNILVNELLHIINVNNWTIFHNYNNINYFYELINMDQYSIYKYLKNYNNILDIIPPNINLYWLKINNYLINSNIKYCPETFNIISKLNINTINYGIMAIETEFSGYIMPIDFTNISRIYIPLLISNGDCGILINNKYYNLSNYNNNYINFNLDKHYLWNFSETHIYILFIDYYINNF